MRPAIVYAAKSTADKNDSIPAQLAQGRAEAEADGWTVIDVFKDENKSAYTGNRGDDLAKAQRLAEQLAAAHGECGLFIQHSDRLARGDGIQAAHLVEYALWAIKSGVRIISKQDPQTFSDLLYAVVTGQRNHEDSKRKSEATREGIGRRAKDKGLPTGGGNRRFGYAWSESRQGGVVLLPHEADVVEERMFRAHLDGTSQLEIGRELTADRIKTVRGGQWHAGTISQILRNPFYKGVIVYGGEEFQGLHEACVSADLWGEVAELRTARKHRTRRPRGQGRTPAGKHLFYGGLLRCVCGGAMTPRTVRRTLKSGEVATYEHYYCLEHHRDPTACPVNAIRREKIDAPAFRYFERVGLDLEATRAQLANQKESRLDRIRSLLAEAEADATKAADRRKRVETDYLDGIIEAEDWNRFRDSLDSDLAAARGQIERLTMQLEKVERTDAGRDLEESVLLKLAAIRSAVAGQVTNADGTEAARAAILRLFEGFTLREPELGLTVPAELAWTDRFVIEPRLRDGASPVPLTIAPVGDHPAPESVTDRLFGPIAIGA